MDSDSASDSGPVDSDSHLMDSDSGLIDSDSDSDSGLMDSDSLSDSRVRTHSNTGKRLLDEEVFKIYLRKNHIYASANKLHYLLGTNSSLETHDKIQIKVPVKISQDLHMVGQMVRLFSLTISNQFIQSDQSKGINLAKH